MATKNKKLSGDDLEELRPKKARKTTVEYDFSRCICLETPNHTNADPVICQSCKKHSHLECVSYVSDKKNFVCLLCKLKLFDPFNPVEKFLHHIVVGDTKTSTVIDAGNIKSMRNAGLEIYLFSIPIKDGQLVHEYPKTLNLSINNTVAHTVQEPTWEHKRRDNPVKITHFLKSGENNIKITTTTYSDTGKLFLLTISLVKPTGVSSLMADITSNRTLDIQEATDRVFDMLSKSSTDGDEVVCMETNRKFHLHCPVTLSRIQIPTRGKECKHLQCFDLQGYLNVTLRTNSFNMRWKCPECNLLARPVDLVVDSYIMQVLCDAPNDATSVEIEKTGECKFDLLPDDDNYSDDNSQKGGKKDSPGSDSMFVLDSE